MFDVSDDLSVASSDPEEGGEVVHSAEPSPRGTSPEEIPEDRSPDTRPPPLVVLYCRGPFEFWEGNHPYGLNFYFLRNETEAGGQGEKLAPGRCAFRDSPGDGPLEVAVLTSNVWDKFTSPIPGSEYEGAWTLREKIRQLARAELELGWLSNFITRSDYVIKLPVRNEGGVWAAGGAELGRAIYTPFREHY